MVRCLRLLAAAAALTLLAGCPSTRHAESPADHPAWRSVTLPVPPGEPGRVTPQDTIVCGGVWYVVGAVLAANGDPRPAVWSSPDALTWTPVAIEALSYYGHLNIMYTVGCRDGRIAVVGAKSGGAHGNPRVSTWYQRPDGSLLEIEAPFSQYGGPDAVSASRITGGPKGWLIAGNRATGAAAWVSPDSRAFTLVEYGRTLPPATTATDAVAFGAGWTAVGCRLAPGQGVRDAAVWTSPDGVGWAESAVPSGAADESMLRVAPMGDGLVAVGVRGDAFGAWLGSTSGWRAAGLFGRARGQVAAAVGDIVIAGDRVLVTTEAGDGHHLWSSPRSADRWTMVPIPGPVTAGGGTALGVAAAGGSVLLVAEDGHTSSVWVTNGLGPSPKG